MTQDASSFDTTNASASSVVSNGPSNPSGQIAQSGLSAMASVSTVNQFFVEPLNPADGGELIAQAIRNVQQSLWLEVYFLTQSHVLDALVQLAAPDPITGQKKDIRVILERTAYPFAPTNTASVPDSNTASTATPTSPTSSSPLGAVAHAVSSWLHGGAASHPVPTYQAVKQKLNDAGIEVRENSTKLMWGGRTHAKYMIIDGQIAYIMTANLTTDSLGSPASHGNPYAASNREYIVIDNDLGRVNTLKAVFSADWDANAPRFDATQLQSSALVISPSVNNQGNATIIVLQMLQQAQTSLMIEMEEIHELPAPGVIEQALTAAVMRKVQVQVILPAKPMVGKATTQDDINALANGNVQLRTSAQPIMHAKMILVDAQITSDATGNQHVTGGLAFIGSQNLTTAGLNQSREVGILVSDVNVLNTLWQTFTLDWNNAQPLSGA